MTIKKSSVSGLWEYMRKRECIRKAREAGTPWPWTQDHILQKYKFTNVQREHDRTSQIFKSMYLAHLPDAPPGVLLYNCGVARYFGTHEFYTSVGWQARFEPELLQRAARMRMEQGKSVFTRAYVITNGGQSKPKEVYVTEGPLRALFLNCVTIASAMTVKRSWQAGYELLRKLEGFGGTGFMAKEVLLDFIQFLPSVLDADTWTPVGPGAMRGLGRIYNQSPYKPVKDPLAKITDIWFTLKPLWSATWPRNRSLSCHDVQFCLCEYDKYERARLGQGVPKNKYTPRT